MNVNQLYNLYLYILGKNQQQGYASPDDFYTVINAAQQNYVDYLLGEYQKYQAGRQIAVVEISNKEKIRQSISPLIYNTILPINPTTGLANYPSDFAMTDAMWNVYGFYNIRFVNQPRLDSFANSSIDPIAENPVYLLKYEGFQFYPTNIGLARMSYVRNPPSIVWGYVYDSYGLPVWNPATSQNPVWGEFDLFNILVRALRMTSVNLDSNVVAQYSEQIKNNGQ